MAETQKEVFTPQVETQVPQSYDEICETEILQHLDFPDTDGEGLGVATEQDAVHEFGDQCFLLQGLLSKAEADHLIKAGEKLGFGAILGATPSYRNCERIMLESESIAEVLWSRVRPFLSDMTIEGDPHLYHVHGVNSLLQGTWTPRGINPIFRLCKYSPGGHFAPHFDGCLVKSPTLRSMKTLMLYLNSDFDGGTTNFVDESQQLYKDSSGRFCAEEKNIICRVKPEPGLAIIFNHHRLHEGRAILNNKKYILRTDIMYERVGGAEVDETDKAALLLVQEAERLECHGECMKAMELYRKAFKMSPSLEQAFR